MTFSRKHARQHRVALDVVMPQRRADMGEEHQREQRDQPAVHRRKQVGGGLVGATIAGAESAGRSGTGRCWRS